ncbi:MAG: AAA family ATPase [Phycisphaerales bacterium]|nr:AAA family ATPase [Phycisphaerales bacterium]
METTMISGTTIEAVAEKVGQIDYRLRGHVAAFTARLNKIQRDGVAGGSPVAAQVDESKVREIAADEARKAARPVVEVRVNDRPAVRFESERVHAKFAETLRKVSAGVPVMLVGPAGSGKTTLAAQVAKALGKSFTFNSMSAGVTESSILGRVLPPTFEFKKSPFVQTYQNGGVHLFDEMDAADPNLLVTINSAIANRKLSIPQADEIVEQHDDCVILAAANTFGNGADRQYVGRNQLDAATVDRFVMGTVEVDYDADLERDIATKICGDKADALLAWAWGVRKAIMAAKMRRLMSTRTVENSAKLLAAGESMTSVKATYFSSWSADEKRLVGAA